MSALLGSSGESLSRICSRFTAVRLPLKYPKTRTCTVWKSVLWKIWTAVATFGTHWPRHWRPATKITTSTAYLLVRHTCVLVHVLLVHCCVTPIQKHDVQPVGLDSVR